MGSTEEHFREEIAALRGEVAGLREVVEGIPAIMKAAIEEAFPALDADESHTVEP